MRSGNHIPVKTLFIALLMLPLSFCRKDVTLELPEYTQKVVIEGSIENGSPATVFLSYSVPYFEEFDFSEPDRVFIRDALVTVTDGDITDTLREVDPALGYLYTGSQLRGVIGGSYTLQVVVDGRKFETSTNILPPVKLDSLYFKGERDSLGFIWQTFSEPPGSGDAYRWSAKRLGRDFFYAAPANSVFDDKFVDGQTFDFAYDRGRQPVQASGTVDLERGYFKRGDSVAVKISRIGRREYIFWSSYYQNKSSNGNPFSAPTNIQSMFGDIEHAIGAFVGYGASIDTIVIKEK